MYSSIKIRVLQSTAVVSEMTKSASYKSATCSAAAAKLQTIFNAIVNGFHVCTLVKERALNATRMAHQYELQHRQIDKTIHLPNKASSHQASYHRPRQLKHAHAILIGCKIKTKRQVPKAESTRPGDPRFSRTIRCAPIRPNLASQCKGSAPDLELSAWSFHRHMTRGKTLATVVNWCATL